MIYRKMGKIIKNKSASTSSIKTFDSGSQKGSSLNIPQMEDNEDPEAVHQQEEQADDELILTESELYNKFKEFRAELIEGERELMKEVSTDICKNMTTELSDSLKALLIPMMR